LRGGWRVGAFIEPADDMAVLQVSEPPVTPLVAPAGKNVAVDRLRAQGEAVLEGGRPDIGNIQGADGAGTGALGAGRGLLVRREVAGSAVR
jgi:hypothetical protein